MNPQSLSTQEDHQAFARQAFAKIQVDFPTLIGSLRVRPVPQVDLSLSFEVQEGLSFRVIATLQGDELGLGVGSAFWCEWFPSSDTEVARKFDDAIRGVLSGQYQTVEHWHNGAAFQAELQQSIQTGWKTVASWRRLHLPFFGRAELRTLRNTVAGI